MRERSRIIASIRSFFDRRNYLETDTPLLSPDLIPESCLEVFETARLPPPESRSRKPEPYWLIPSPEIWMKKLIARHRVSMYQICKCFRNGESSGRFHSPEFTMLEYYTMDAGYKDSLIITEDLFAELGIKVPFLKITMEEAFSRWAGFSLCDAVKRGNLLDEAKRLGLDVHEGIDIPTLYDLIFIHAVEQKIPRDMPVALMDYPAFVPCLAKKHTAGTVERWELYANGIELANCYSEETDPAEVRCFFENEAAAKKKSALVNHQIDSDYWKIFSLENSGSAFPRCSGVALGLDRLIMVLTGRSTIDGVLPFPMK